MLAPVLQPEALVSHKLREWRCSWIPPAAYWPRSLRKTAFVIPKSLKAKLSSGQMKRAQHSGSPSIKSAIRVVFLGERLLAHPSTTGIVIDVFRRGNEFWLSFLLW